MLSDLVTVTFILVIAVVSIPSTISCTIGSTMGLSGVVLTTNFTVSQLPKSSILDQTYSETRSDVDSRVYMVLHWWC